MVTCLYTNAQGLYSKLPELRHRQQTAPSDIIAITETWLSDDILDSEIEVNSMSLIRRDRPTRGGGVAIYHRKSLKCEVVTAPHLSLTDALVCKLQLSGRDTCLLVVIYRPPNSSQENDEKLISLLKAATSMKYSHYLIMGDFNLPSMHSASVSGPPFKSQLLDHISIAPLYNHVTQPTRYRGSNKPSVLDLVLTNEDLMVESMVYDPPLGNSDHIVLTFDYICYNCVHEPLQSVHRTATDYDLLQSIAEGEDWNFQAINSCQDAWISIKDKITELVNKSSHILPKKPAARVNHWIRSRTRKWITKKNEVWRLHVREPSDRTWLDYKELRNYCTALIRADKSKWQFSMVQKFKNDRKLLYKSVNDVRKVKHGIPPLMSESGLTDSPKETADALIRQFNSVTTFCSGATYVSNPIGMAGLSQIVFTPSTVARKLSTLRQNTAPGIDGLRPKVIRAIALSLSIPLSVLFQHSFDSSTFPNDWKQGVITPIYKGGRRSDPANYRPITLLPIISKVMESIVADEMTRYFEEMNILSGAQHGFRRRRSCLTNLLLVRDCWTKEVDNGHQVDVIYLDFSKAFDRVQHPVLLQKLSDLGIGGSLLRWIEYYLQERTSTVKISGVHSDSLPVSSGVPQGSVLGPLLFLIHINDLPSHVKSKITIFADDAKISRAITSPADHDVLQSDLNSIHNWSVANQLPLNPGKCHVISLRGNVQHEYSLGIDLLSRVQSERDLGVIVQNNLGNTLQCIRASSTANRHLRLLRRLFGHFEPDIAPQLIKIYIRPHVEYAVQAWSPWHKRDIRLLEQPQRRATKCTRGFSELTYVNRLRILNLFSSEYRRLRGDLIFTYQILTSDNHPCKSLLSLSSSTRCRGHKLKLSLQNSRLDCRKYSFALRVCDKWNSLPAMVVDAPNLTLFKQLLDSHLSDIHYHTS